jgi:hypothetical protein
MCNFITKKMVGRLYLTVLFVLLSALHSYAQVTDGIDEVMRVMGADSPEDVDPEEFERLYDFIDHPLRINMVPESRLVASGLFTKYQAASLTDYRRRHGNVVSYAELAAVDGFGADVVSNLRRFISLECHDLHEDVSGMRHDFALRMSSKPAKASFGWNYGLKYRVRSERFSLALASSRSYSAGTPWPDAYSGSFTYDFRRFRGRISVGDFNARFGQGLALWSGMFMTSLNAPEAFMKKPSGISETWSFTGSSALTGIAANMSVKHLTFTFLTAVPGLKSFLDKPGNLSLMPAVNIAWQGAHGSLSATQVAQMRTSADGAFCVKGVNLFAEVAYDWVAKDINAVAGTDFPIGDGGRIAALMKYIPCRFDGPARHQAASSAAFTFGPMVASAGTSASAAAGNRHSMTFSADLVRYVEPKEDGVPLSLQSKFLAEWRFIMNPYWETRLRITERLRTWGHMSRTDCRADLIYSAGPWMAAVRLNHLHCVGHAFAGYVEQGCKTSVMSAYLREGLFFVDDWEDRIYVYERDAPGSFNVPAMYGRGWFASLVVSGKVSQAVRLYLRASYTGYDFMQAEKRKPGKAELKFQLVLRYL